MKLLLQAAETANDLNTDPGFWAEMASTKGIAVVLVVALIVGLFWFIKRERRIKRANDSAAGNPLSVVLLVGLLSLPLAGCSFFNPTKLDEESTAANADDWRFGWKVVSRYHDRANATPAERATDKDFWDAGTARADAMHARTQEGK